MPEKLISVIIPTYNYAAVLPRAVGSVLAQLADADAELLVIDDGSTDATPTVIAELQQTHGSCFTALRQDNGGSSAARNCGIAHARGRFLIFLDADDEMLPGTLAALRAHVTEQPQTRMVVGGYRSVAFDGKRTEHSAASLMPTAGERLYAYLFDKRLSLCNGACAMHREVFSAGLYPEHLRNAEDIPVFAQALARFSCSVLEHPMVIIHKHPDSLRRNLQYARQTGLALVEEVFSPQRMPREHQHLKRKFHGQRCLSLFRLFNSAGEKDEALMFYREALRADPLVILRWTYTRKLLRLLLPGLTRRRGR